MERNIHYLKPEMNGFGKPENKGRSETAESKRKLIYDGFFLFVETSGQLKLHALAGARDGSSVAAKYRFAGHVLGGGDITYNPGKNKGVVVSGFDEVFGAIPNKAISDYLRAWGFDVCAAGMDETRTLPNTLERLATLIQ